MATRRAETILVGASAGLLLWGMGRVVSRGEPAARNWIVWAMMAMVVVTALNIALRKRAIAIACGALCVLFVAAVLLAASAGAEHGAANRLAAIVRAVLFFVLIGVACLLQALPARASVGSDAPVGG